VSDCDEVIPNLNYLMNSEYFNIQYNTIQYHLCIGFYLWGVENK
jgi:hypothetical protein